MKNFYSFLFALLISGLGFGQTLTAGDLAIIGLSVDDEEALIVALADIPSGEYVFFTDEEWGGSSFNSGEGFYEWITPSITAGTVFTLDINNSSVGGTINHRQGSFALGNSGDGFFLYQTSSNQFNSGTYTILGFAGEDSGDAGTLIGTGLTLGTDAIYYGGDNGIYIGSRTGQNKAGYLSLIYGSSWSTSGSSQTFDLTDFVIAGSSPSNPDTFSASPSSSTQIDLSYDDNTSEDNVIILFNTDNVFTTPSGVPTAVGTSFAGGTILVNSNGSSTYNHTSLSENTTYYYMAYSYDGSDYSTGLSAEATTPCSAISSFPFTEGFESGVPPTCWTSYRGTNNIGTSEDWTSNSDAYTGSNAAFVGWENIGETTEDWLVSPALDLSIISNPELSFYTKDGSSDNYSSSYSIRVSTTSQTDHTSFTSIQTYTETELGNSYNQKTVDLSSYDGQIIYIAFVLTQDDGDSWFLDDVEVYETISSDNDSEVYESSPQISATSIVAADVTTSGSSEDVFSFIIEDLGTSDGLPTNVTTMRFVPGVNNSADWSDAIAGITIYDENLIDYTPTTTITDTEIILNFASPIVITDGTSLEFFFGIYLNTTNIIDNSVIQVQINESSSGFSSDNSGSGFSDPFLLGDIIGNNITIDVEATEIIFSEQPTETIVNEIMDSVSITAIDTNGNIDLDYDFDISITSTGTLSNTPVTLAAIDGVATFSSLTHTVTGTALTLTASDGLFTDIVSDVFDIIEVPVGPVVIALQDFDGTTPEWTYTNDIALFGSTSNFGNDYYGVININDASPLDYSEFSNNIFGENDLNSPNGTSGFATMTFSSIDLTSHNNVVLTFDWEIVGYNASNDDARYEIYYDGIGQGLEYLVDGGVDSESAEGTISISIPNSVEAVYLEIEIRNDGGSGYSGFDNFKLEGELISSVTTYTYNDGVWSPSNPDGTSTASENIVIESGNATISSDTDINSITVNPGAGLTIDSDITLTVNDVLLLESTSTSYSSLIVNGTVTGTVNYSRYVNSAAESGTTAGDNDLISAPLTGQTFGDFKTTNPNILSGTIGGVGPYYLFGPFDTANNEYVLYYDTDNDASTLDAGVGYRTGSNGGGAYIFSGNVETTDVTVSIHNETQSNWNLIGNPYPSYISLSDFLTENSSLFDTYSSGVYGYNGADSNPWVVWNNAYALANPGAVIAPGQGFYVSSLNANSMVTFNSTSRTFGSTDDFIAGRSTETVSNITLSLSNNSSSFSTDFYFTEFSTQGLDSGYDSSLYSSTIPSFAIYSHLVTDNTGIPMAIQSLGETDYNNVTIPLGVNANQGEQITFSITTNTIPANIDVYLEDTLENTSTLITSGDYTLTLSTTLNGTGRFYLNFVNSTLSTINNVLETLNIYTNESDKTIVIQGQLTEKTTVNIYDIQGRIIKATQLLNTKVSQSIDVRSLSNGVYIVELNNNSQTKTQKVVIR